jgi:tetratricopeptide (TPR) repeat protein
VIALASFPLRITLTGYPWLLFVSWVFAAENESTAAAEIESEVTSVPGRVAVPARVWSAALAVVLAPALAIHTLSLLGRLEASRIVRTTSQVAQMALARGEAAARPVLQANLQPLRRAAELDPLAIGVPLNIGAHYLLLGNGAAAIESYEHGLSIEPRAELHFNMARALLSLGRRDQAVMHAEIAEQLDPNVDDDAYELGLRAAPPENWEEEKAQDRRRERRELRRSERSRSP